MIRQGCIGGFSVKKEWIYPAGLFLAALIWGFAFVAQRSAGAVLETFFFNAIRFLLGAACLFPICSARRISFRDPLLWKLGAALSLCIFTAGFFQQEALRFAGSGKVGFITSFYIILVPIGQLFLGKKPDGRIWLSVLLSLVGLYLLSVQQDGGGFGRPEMMVFLTALFFAIHILLTERYVSELNVLALSAVQFLLAGFLSLFLAILRQSLDFGAAAEALPASLYAGILSCGLGYTLQLFGQKGTKASVASLIMSFEAVFAALGGALLLNERLSSREIAGCVLMLFAVLLAQLPLKFTKKV